MSKSKKLYYLPLFIYICFILSSIIIYFTITHINFAFPTLERLNDFHKQSITLLSERIKLLSGLATLLISVSFVIIGFLFKQKGNFVRYSNLMLFILAIYIWSISIICGYFAYGIIIEVLSYKTWNPQSNLVKVPIILQFIFIMFGFLFLFIGLSKILTEKEKQSG